MNHTALYGNSWQILGCTSLAPSKTSLETTSQGYSYYFQRLASTKFVCQIPWPFFRPELCWKTPNVGADLKVGQWGFYRKRGKFAENRGFLDAISGLMADFLRLIDVNAGGLGLKKGQGILHPTSTKIKGTERAVTVLVLTVPFGKGLLRSILGRFKRKACRCDPQESLRTDCWRYFVECFRGLHRGGGGNLTSCFRFSGPFFHAAKWALSTLKLAPPWSEPPEAPLEGRPLWKLRTHTHTRKTKKSSRDRSAWGIGLWWRWVLRVSKGGGGGSSNGGISRFGLVHPDLCFPWQFLFLSLCRHRVDGVSWGSSSF